MVHLLDGQNNWRLRLKRVHELLFLMLAEILKTQASNPFHISTKVLEQIQYQHITLRAA